MKPETEKRLVALLKTANVVTLADDNGWRTIIGCQTSAETLELGVLRGKLAKATGNAEPNR